MKFNFSHIKIKKFTYIKEKSSFIIIDIEGKIFRFYYPNLYDIYEIDKDEIYLSLSQFQDINISIKDIFYIKDYLILLDVIDNFYFIQVDNLGLNISKLDKNKIERKFSNCQEKIISSSTQNLEKNIININQEIGGIENINIDIYDKNIIKICSMEKNYSKILKISSSEFNIMFVDDNHKIFYINSADLNKMNTTSFSPKVIHDFKCKNIQEVACGENFWLLLEREEMKPLEKWNVPEVIDWFRSMNLDEFSNIIKYEKITGKDIVDADETFFVNIMGMMDDNQIKKVKYEMNTVKNVSCKKTKLWGWGSNKQGQLGQINYNHNFLKSPTKINLPEMKHESDFIIKIYCGKTFSLLQTKFGELFMTGNYSTKDKANIQTENNEKNNLSKDNHSGRKNKIVEKNKKDVGNISSQNRWVNITKEVCFDSLIDCEE
jgi:hypothetical protein